LAVQLIQPNQFCNKTLEGLREFELPTVLTLSLRRASFLYIHFVRLLVHRTPTKQLGFMDFAVRPHPEIIYTPEESEWRSPGGTFPPDWVIRAD
jgi:hypothetical protein